MSPALESFLLTKTKQKEKKGKKKTFKTTLQKPKKPDNNKIFLKSSKIAKKLRKIFGLLSY